MSSPAPDKRRHFVYMTRNTEYHCRDGECVGVRDRQTGTWQPKHPAIRGKLLGALHTKNTIRNKPKVGLRLVFFKDKAVMTSRLLYAGRPEKDSIFAYTSQCRTGIITNETT